MLIQVIISSVRPSRIGGQIAEYVAHFISQTSIHNVELVDLAEWYLPLNDEPGLPANKEYLQPHTKQWSEKIASGNAYLFVLPQYNWGYPASLKNAIDHLYHEWRDKPAAIVSYANRGGGKAATQLKQVLQGVHMQTLQNGVEIPLSQLTFDNQGRIEKPEESLYVFNKDLHNLRSELFSVLKARSKLV